LILLSLSFNNSFFQLQTSFLYLGRHSRLGVAKDRLALLLAGHQIEGKDETQGGQGADDGESNNKTLVVVLFCDDLVLVVVGGALKVVTRAAEEIVGAGGVPGIAEVLLNGHLFKLPLVELGVVLLGVVPLAVEPGAGFAFIEASFHDEETLAGFTHSPATVPAVSFSVAIVELVSALDSGAVAASVLLPGVTLGHIIPLGTRRVLVEVLQVALVGDGIRTKQSSRNGIVGVRFLVEEPHGVSVSFAVDDFKGTSPHFLAEFGTIRVDVLELRASFFPGASHGGKSGEDDELVGGKDHDDGG
jgi:hypothetical protein